MWITEVEVSHCGVLIKSLRLFRLQRKRLQGNFLSGACYLHLGYSILLNFTGWCIDEQRPTHGLDIRSRNEAQRHATHHKQLSSIWEVTRIGHASQQREGRPFSHQSFDSKGGLDWTFAGCLSATRQIRFTSVLDVSKECAIRYFERGRHNMQLSDHTESYNGHQQNESWRLSRMTRTESAEFRNRHTEPCMRS